MNPRQVYEKDKKYYKLHKDTTSCHKMQVGDYFKMIYQHYPDICYGKVTSIDEDWYWADTICVSPNGKEEHLKSNGFFIDCGKEIYIRPSKLFI
jgi:hypothetical protein